MNISRWTFISTTAKNETEAEVPREQSCVLALCEWVSAARISETQQSSALMTL